MLIASGLLAILVLTAATAYFVAQEFAWMAVDRGRLTRLAEAGDGKAAKALEVSKRLSFMLSGAQFGITVTALLVGYVAEPLLGQGLVALLSTSLPAAVTTAISMAVALGLATFVQMVLGELFPKNLAIARPETLARALAGSTLVYLAVAGPLIRLFDSAANRFLRAIGIEPVEELAEGATTEDLRAIIDDAEEQGDLEPALALLLERGLAFRDLTAGQAMTPRTSVDWVAATDPVSAVVDRLDSGHSRFPVIGTDLDDLVGVVGIAEVLTVPAEARATTSVRQVAAEALVVPETIALPALLELLRTERRQLACVIDEFGGFAGVISLEDLAEELVGEIIDEDDEDETALAARVAGQWRVAGSLRLDELEQLTDIDLPTSDHYDTLSGLILEQLGRMPVAGDVVDAGSVVLEVVEIDNRVASLVEIREVAR